MSRPTKQISSKGIAFDTQYEMCDVVYRKLIELFLEVRRYKVSIEVKSISSTFEISLQNSSQNNFVNFHLVSKSNSRTTLGDFDLKKLSLSEIEDPFYKYISRTEFLETRAELYSEWLESVKNAMQKLLEEQRKYEDIMESIKNIPMFTPPREVLFEKINK